MVLSSTGGKKVNVFVTRDAAKVLDQRTQVADQRRPVFGAEDHVQQVESVGVGHKSVWNAVHGHVGERDHVAWCRR